MVPALRCLRPAVRRDWHPFLLLEAGRSGLVTEHNAKLERIVAAMADAGQELAVQWGHQPWSDSWAKLVAQTMLEALESTDEPIFVLSEVSGPNAVFCLDCMDPGRPTCDRDHHGLVTLGELATVYASG